MLVGGGKIPPEVIARFVELAGGANARIVLLPTASESADDPKEHASLQELWRTQRNAEVVVLHTRDRQRADDPAFCEPLRTATGVWIGGGVQRRIADAFLGTRVEQELMALLARGGVIGGTSAGTAIQSRTMIESGMEDPVVGTGFDFVPGVVSDQHFLKRQRLPRLLKVLGRHPGLLGVGVDESTAAEIRGDELRVIGRSKVVLAMTAGNGHAEVVREVEAMTPDERAIDLGAWRHAAKERATWSLAKVGAPQLERGTLLVGDMPDLLAMFGFLTSGSEARLVGLAAEESHAKHLRDRLAKTGASSVEVFVVDAAGTSRAACERALANATGVVFADEHPFDSARLLSQGRDWPLATATAGVLARGGVVWGNSILGEVVVHSWPANANAPDDFGYERGLALLPGTAIVRRPVGGGAPGAGPITDGAPHEWLARHALQLQGIVAIHVEAAAMVAGSTLEALGELPTHVMLARDGGEPGTERPRVTRTHKQSLDLTAPAPSGATAPADGKNPR